MKHRPIFTKTALSALVLALSILIGASALQASPAQTVLEDKTLSPYFHVKSDDPKTDRLPLKSTQADVRILGVIAEVTITQVYKNEGRNTLEAIYVFPGSTRAAVHSMRMTVGDRVIEADIMERKKARRTYEQAKKEGRTASLLEQQRPNVFQMNVANILPGDTIKVEMKYTELLEPTEQVYEFVYPAVVGPRYSETPAQGAPDTEKWVKNPYLHSGQTPPYQFGLAVRLETGIPIARLTSPNHEIRTAYTGKSRVDVSLAPDPKAGTRDFVLQYKLAGGQIETGLLLYPGREDNHFLLMMEPPARVRPDEVVPREYIFIVDVSGSMNGFPLEKVAKPMMKEMISNLKANEYMNIILFAGGSEVLSTDRSLAATEENKRKAIRWMEEHHGAGGTRILPALQRALALPAREGVSRIITVVTDGYVNVEPQVFELIRRNLGRANLFTFGIGRSVNRFLIEGMARTGMGEPFFVMNPEEGRDQARRFRAYVEQPVLTDIEVRFNNFSAFDIEPMAVPDLFALRPIILMGKYQGRAGGSIVVTGKTASGAFKKEIRLSEGEESAQNTALRLLWARHRIRRIADLNSLVNSGERVMEITELGLKYHLMTQFTSFVAVDKVRRADGKLVTVKQPLPLPDGVSDAAVGDRSMGFAPLARPSVAMKAMAPRDGGLRAQAAPVEPSAAEEKPVGTGNGDKEKPAGPMRGRHVEVKLEQVTGALNPDQVRRALSQRLKLLEDCYVKAVSLRKTNIGGEITFRFVIDQRGKVTAIDIKSASMNDTPTQMCLKTVFQGTTFPPPQQGVAHVLVRLICTK